MAARSLVVKVTAGAEAPERCSQGLTVAATAAAAGVDVSLWLTGESTRLALADGPTFELEHAADPVELLTAVIEAGTVTVCTQCAARRGMSPVDLRPGVRIAGSAAFVEEVLAPDVQALVY